MIDILDEGQKTKTIEIPNFQNINVDNFLRLFDAIINLRGL